MAWTCAHCGQGGNPDDAKACSRCRIGKTERPIITTGDPHIQQAKIEQKEIVSRNPHLYTGSERRSKERRTNGYGVPGFLNRRRGGDRRNG